MRSGSGSLEKLRVLTYYLTDHPEITDVLFTGGYPFIMPARNLAGYIEPLFEVDLLNPHPYQAAKLLSLQICQ